MALFYVVRLETETGDLSWAVTTSLRQEVHRFRNRTGVGHEGAVKALVEGVFLQETTALDVMEKLSATDFITGRRRAG